MSNMFNGASAFVKNVTVWNVCKVSDGGFDSMFTDSGLAGTTLENGICIVCPSGTTSGSGEYVTGGNPCTSD
jgi:hypothetical protein